MGRLFEMFSATETGLRRRIRNTREQTAVGGRVSFGEDRNQAIVVYKPFGIVSPKTTTIVYFHGGGYSVGTPESMEIAALFFCKRGYRLISVGYRLLPDNRFPCQIEDAFAGVKTALDYLDEDVWEGDGVRPPIILGGNSAGGHAAAMVAYSRELQEQYGIDADRITGFLSVAGLMDLDVLTDDLSPRRMRRIRSSIDLPGEDLTTPDALRIAAHRYSPLHLVDTQTVVPFLGIHGKYDSVVPCESQMRFVDKVNGLAGKDIAELLVLPDRRYQHIGLTAGLFMEDPRTSVALQGISDWLGRVAP